MLFEFGASKGNRTLILCLEGSGSTIKLYSRNDSPDYPSSYYGLKGDDPTPLLP